MPRKPSANPVRGALTPREKTALVLIARDAFHYQSALRTVSPGETFDAWRHRQVMEQFQVAGISALTRPQWRPMAAHFLTLAGKLDEAFDMLQKTGSKSYRPAGPGDTWESAEALVAKIREAIAAHALITLAPGVDHIHPGWLLAAARQRTQKPSLTMDTLAERLDPTTLVGLLSHIRNAIAKREGRPLAPRAPRSYPSRPDPDTIDPSPSDPF